MNLDYKTTAPTMDVRISAYDYHLDRLIPNILEWAMRWNVGSDNTAFFIIPNRKGHFGKSNVSMTAREIREVGMRAVRNHHNPCAALLRTMYRTAGRGHRACARCGK